MKVLIIDNYDSFTFNLYQVVGEVLERSKDRFQIDVIKNDQLTLLEIKKRGYDKIIISPGPGNPSDLGYFGVCSEVLLTLGKGMPVLGVCLGMQGLAHFYGGEIIKARKPMHGKTSLVKHDSKGIFTHLPQNLEVMRYHSLLIKKGSLPPELIVTAVASDTDEIMGIRHKKYPLEGIQFHPESFRTEGGKEMIRTFIEGDYQ